MVLRHRSVQPLTVMLVVEDGVSDTGTKGVWKMVMLRTTFLSSPAGSVTRFNATMGGEILTEWEVLDA